MNDKILVAVAGVLAGAGGFLAGVLVRQPEINKLQNQVEVLQSDIHKLEDAVAEQNDEIAQLLLNYRKLRVYQFTKRKTLKESIREQLICQYAAADYLTLLLDCAAEKKKMTVDEVRYYEMYGKMLIDDHIDDDELDILTPIMLERHGSEIEDLKGCDLTEIVERIRTYGTTEDGPELTHFFRRE